MTEPKWYDETEVIAVEQFDGYEIRVEQRRYGHAEPDGTPPEPIEMMSAYNPAGHYIGNPRTAKFLVTERGITPEVIPGNTVCSIGFCAAEEKWYGWSHRAMFGFPVGHVVEDGEVIAETIAAGTVAKTLDDAKRFAIEFARAVG